MKYIDMEIDKTETDEAIRQALIELYNRGKADGIAQSIDIIKNTPWHNIDTLIRLLGGCGK